MRGRKTWNRRRRYAHDGRPHAAAYPPGPNSPQACRSPNTHTFLAPISRASSTSTDGTRSHAYTCQGRRRRRPHRTAPSGHGQGKPRAREDFCPATATDGASTTYEGCDPAPRTSRGATPAAIRRATGSTAALTQKEPPWRSVGLRHMRAEGARTDTVLEVKHSANSGQLHSFGKQTRTGAGRDSRNTSTARNLGL